MEEVTTPVGSALRQLVNLACASDGGRALDGSQSLSAAFGTGVIHWQELEPGLSLVILSGTLDQPLALRQQADITNPTVWLLVCQLAQPQLAPTTPGSIQLTSSILASITRLPAQISQAVVGVSITASLLRSWLGPADGPVAAALALLQPLDLDTSPAPALRLVLSQLVEHQADPDRSPFYYGFKVRELLYQLLQELVPRLLPPRHLHAADVEKVLRARGLLLSSLAVVPHLPQLAAEVGLRVPVLQVLFRQLFASSPYQYFQQARMQEARRLLQTRSVSEVGFTLGFSNLSHFGRLFEKHHQLTPKKYQAACAAAALPGEPPGGKDAPGPVAQPG